MKKYKTIIVDDEKLARIDLKDVLKSFEEFEIVGETNSLHSAEVMINKLHPDIVFLDIQLRGESGFDLLDKIDHDLNFIFVTAYDKYAIRAFDVNAIDYLLKPVSEKRIQQTLTKLNHQVHKEPDGLHKLEYNDIMYLMLNNKYRFLKIDSIIAIKSNADYTDIYTTDKTHLITRKTMKEWETRLPENHFCRIHRETIVNLVYISKLDDGLSHSHKVYLEGVDRPFLISRRFSAKIKEKFL